MLESYTIMDEVRGGVDCLELPKVCGERPLGIQTESSGANGAGGLRPGLAHCCIIPPPMPRRAEQLRSNLGSGTELLEVFFSLLIILGWRGDLLELQLPWTSATPVVM